MAEWISKTRLSTIGRYEVFAAIGRDEVGTAYRALDRDSGNFVAVRILATNFASNPQLFDLLTREFRAVIQFHHPNVVNLLDFGLDGNRAFVVTEFLEGLTLSQLIEAHRRLPEETSVRIITQIGQALEYALQKTDLPWGVEPANILIRTDGVAKLLYSGVTRECAPLERGSVVARPVLGVPDATEKGLRLSDAVYDLAGTLCMAVTGQMPEIVTAPLISRRTRKPKPETRFTKKLGSGYSEGLEFALRLGLDSDPGKRPASILDFLRLVRGRARAAGSRKQDQRPGAGDADNRRIHVRYALGVGSNCTISSSVVDSTGAPESNEIWPAVLRDLSAGGIGILLARRFEPGVELVIELPVALGATPQHITVRVVRVKRESHGHWVHGCEFPAPLNEGELRWVLEQVTPAGESSSVIIPAVKSPK